MGEREEKNESDYVRVGGRDRGEWRGGEKEKERGKRQRYKQTVTMRDARTDSWL